MSNVRKLFRAISPHLRMLLGKSIYNNIRAYYLFDSKSPFPLYEREKFDPKWDTYRKPMNDSREVVYIVSPTQRSGTNYLISLLNKHKDLHWPNNDEFPSEACLYSNSNNLKTYCGQTTSLWGKWTKNGKKSLEYQTKELLSSIGNGILDYAYKFVPKGKTLLLKTPDSHQLENLFLLFPNAKVIILNRDGRDTVQSFSKSWGQKLAFGLMCKRWSKRVSSINKFVESARNSGFSDQILQVRYDNLNNNTGAELSNILEFLNIDKTNYPFQEAENSPIFGSSQYKTNDKVQWVPLDKTKNFSATNNWNNWNNWQKKVFKWFAGSELIQLGFEQNNKW